LAFGTARGPDVFRGRSARRGRGRWTVFDDGFFFDFVILRAAGFFVTGRFVPGFLRVAMAALRNRLFGTG
jgi:hypothetical protein